MVHSPPPVSALFHMNILNPEPHHSPFIVCLPGSDGTIHFWDKDARTRLKSASLKLSILLRLGITNKLCHVAFEPSPGPITSTAFNRTGAIFAYSVSYDWSKGHSGNTPGHPNKLMLHACKDEEVKKRPRK